MHRTLPFILVAWVLTALAAPAAAEPPSSLTDAFARVADVNLLDSRQSHGPRTLGPPRRARRKPPAKRAVITGFIVGALVGGTVAYREYGPEGIWYGVYTVGLPCAVAGWVVSR